MILLAEEVNELWKWPNFLILAGLLGYMIKKHGGAFLSARSEQIREGLEAGKRAQAEADAKTAEVNARIANLEKDIAGLRASSREELERESARIRKEADAEIDRIERHTGVEVVSIGKQAREELRRYAAALAIELAEKNIRSRMTPDVQSGLLRTFEADLEKVGGARR